MIKKRLTNSNDLADDIYLFSFQVFCSQILRSNVKKKAQYVDLKENESTVIIVLVFASYLHEVN